MYGTADALTSKWCDFVETNINTIRDMIPNLTVAHSLDELNESQGIDFELFNFCN